MDTEYPYVQHEDGYTRKVLNLGYLLKNWKGLTYGEPAFEVDELREWYVNRGMTPPKGWCDCMLTAYFTDGRIYRTTFADETLLWNWLKRPVFYGLKVKWYGTEYEITRGRYEEPPIKKH